MLILSKCQSSLAFRWNFIFGPQGYTGPRAELPITIPGNDFEEAKKNTAVSLNTYLWDLVQGRRMAV